MWMIFKKGRGNGQRRGAEAKVPRFIRHMELKLAREERFNLTGRGFVLGLCTFDD